MNIDKDLATLDKLGFTYQILDSNTKHKLDFWAQKNQNVLFIGHRGVGKTSITHQTWERNAIKGKYFSCPTLDPYIDLRGLPRIVQNPVTNANELHLIRQPGLELAEAVFLDELNRGADGIGNAVMEMTQFKTINGEPLPKLRMVWAAINPWDVEETYAVEQLDPALFDRFPIKVYLPYQPDLEYFAQHFGELNADNAIKWWHGQSLEAKKEVSPRCLFGALDWYLNCGGDLEDKLVKIANVNELRGMINSEPVAQIIGEFVLNDAKTEAQKWIRQENNFMSAWPLIQDHLAYIEFFVPLLSNEKIASLMSTDDNITITEWVIQHSPDYTNLEAVVQAILDANANDDLVQFIKMVMLANGVRNGVELGDLNPGVKVGYQISPDGNKVPYLWHLHATGVKSNMWNMGTMNEKIGSYNFFARFVEANATEEEAITALEFLESIANSAKSAYTLLDTAKFPKSLDIINNLFHTLYCNHYYTVDDIAAICPSVVKECQGKDNVLVRF